MASMSGMQDWEHNQQIAQARTRVIAKACAWSAYALGHPGELIPHEELDAAVLEMAQKMNEPRTCECCGQAIKVGETH